MTIANGQNNRLLQHLFRQEYAKMTAVLCRHFGLQHIEVAEDVASETFLKATEYWMQKGIPENPVGWLYTVAKNKAKDHLRRNSIFESKIKNHLSSEKSDIELDFTEKIIEDSQLAMIFAVCNISHSEETQICLALQILCGFSVQEIADAFLSKPETIKKRLQRGRNKLREEKFQICRVDKEVIENGLSMVLKTLYLFFNEGYFSRSNNEMIRKELCSEALRLTLELTKNSFTNIPETNALIALMCFQSSRLEARININGEAVLFEEQDKGLWDSFLIEKGNLYLIKAFEEREKSKYHFEAAIAYWHISAADENLKWTSILQLYNQLLIKEYSPLAALNRAFAFAKVYGCAMGISETEKLNLNDGINYHSLLGYLYEKENIKTSLAHYHEAFKLSKSKIEKQTLKRKISELGGS
ncbi:RNA polymerase sigma-70 factor, ECF subfamily [Chryseobacterium taeanense]|uniref:RNA polymerase sigma-70 factor, ECF subfamily n=1 Tax=Chryseobacterium taeanense TaxID=311334 RepID=A0A1G8FJM0_9FLAO|nr:sigma-70 family RNA polymerase sigma factor [Chryseobacterium taeanense]SDH82327.1 RNA polymerase sigma-70 factor, ECF subfamily [Chryseobacterium taeanense]